MKQMLEIFHAERKSFSKWRKKGFPEMEIVA